MKVQKFPVLLLFYLVTTSGWAETFRTQTVRLQKGWNSIFPQAAATNSNLSAPTISGTIANQRVYQYSSIRLFAGVTIRGVDDLQTLIVTVTLSDATHGNLSSLGDFLSLGGGVYRLGSTNAGVSATEATTALRNLIFNPTTGRRVHPGAPETTSFVVTVEDNFAAPVVDGLTTVTAFHEFSAKLLAFDGKGSDRFGSAVAATRDVAVIGTPLDDNERGSNAGAAYIFVRDSATEQWTYLQKVMAGDGTASDEFGGAIAIDGDTFVVGARLGPGVGSSGAAYVFQRTGTGSNSWMQVAKLVPSDAVASDQFALSVGISGDLIAVGSPLDDDHGTSSGSVYLFSRNQGGTNNWGQMKKIVASDAAAGDQFGFSVSLRGDFLAVGAPFDVLSPFEGPNLSRCGSAYLFYSLYNWGQFRKVIPADAMNGDRFGTSVSLGGIKLPSAPNWNNTSDLAKLVIGASRQSQLGTDAGAVYIFAPLSCSFTQISPAAIQAKLLPPVAQNNDQFGTAVSISQDKIVVGSPFQGRAETNGEFGAAYLFGEDQGGIFNWGLVEIFDRADAKTGDQFGTSVVISSNTVVVGVPHDDDKGNGSGSAYIYRTKYNNAPIVVEPLPNLTGSLATPFNFEVPASTFADVDVRDPLKISAYIVEGLPRWMGYDPPSNRFYGLLEEIGQYTFVVVATDEDGASVTSSFTLSVGPNYVNSLNAWRSANFGAAAGDPGQSSLWDNSADPDGDGVVNFTEYLFGTNPKGANDSTLQIAQQPDGSLAVSYRRRADVYLLNYTLQTSTDCVNWNDAASIIQSQSVATVEATLETVTCVIPANLSGSGLFFRVHVLHY